MYNGVTGYGESMKKKDPKNDKLFMWGTAIFFLVFLLFSTIIALSLSLSFQLILLCYAITTFTYSKLLKKIPVVDLVTLACLYLLRIIGGASITSLEISNWLITFSVFFFLFLAGIKRWIEIERSSGALLSSRGYVKEDINFMTHLSYFCGLISVLIICLYNHHRAKI